ncbi:hypothetical protein Q7C36_011035 [Tachysurus vachellii]|uniref:Uncharacterized protein n=1 Tax=Tachysurus vachellii TaxID=175792 RepID=A0AA88SPC8_TACVA|nr:hypothetical protein Q7C36_011035 [Tachysurus vachellii]
MQISGGHGDGGGNLSTRSMERNDSAVTCHLVNVSSNAEQAVKPPSHCTRQTTADKPEVIHFLWRVARSLRYCGDSVVTSGGVNAPYLSHTDRTAHVCEDCPYAMSLSHNTKRQISHLGLTLNRFPARRRRSRSPQ